MKYPLLNSLNFKKIKEQNLQLEIKVKEAYIKSFEFFKTLKKEKVLLKYITITGIITYFTYAFSSFEYKWIPFFLFIVLYPILALHLHPKIKLKWELKNFLYILKPKHIISIVSIIAIIFLFFWSVIFLILPLLELHAHRVFFYLLAIPAFFSLFLINSIFLFPFIDKTFEILKTTIYLIKSSFIQLSIMWLILISFHIIVEIFLYLSKAYVEYHLIFLFFYILIQLPVTIASIYIVLNTYNRIIYPIK